MQLAVTVLTTQLTIAGDVSSVNLHDLEARLRDLYDCSAPCELLVTLSASSVLVTSELSVPTADSTSLNAASAAADAAVARPPASLSAALGVTVEAVSPTVGVQSRTVARRVAPPPPQGAQPAPPPPPSQLASSPDSGESTAIIIGAVAAAAVLAAAALYLWRSKRTSGKGTGPVLAGRAPA